MNRFQEVAARLIASVYIVLATCTPMLAGTVRRTTDISPFFNPARNPEMLAFFNTPEGDWRVTGGVVLSGRAQFYYDNGNQVTEVPVGQLKISFGSNGQVFVTRGGQVFRLNVIPGLACPLSQFLVRGGQVAYTQLRDVDATMIDQMRRIGLLDSDLAPGYVSGIAKEFAQTPFERLFERADNADITAMDPKLVKEALDNLNREIKGSVGSSPDRRVLIHADFQIIYKIFLMSGTGEIDTQGVPVRYRIEYRRGGLPVFVSIDRFSENWADNANLSDDPSTAFGGWQYRVVSAFQTAGIFRTFLLRDKDAFAQFSKDACAKL